MARTLRKKLLSGQRIRVMVVDDSVSVRHLVTRAIEADPAIEVVGSAANGAIALARIPQITPDVVTLDIEMPEMGGLEALRHIRRDYPDLRVVMFSSLTERGAAVTLQALELGADDYMAKADGDRNLEQSVNQIRVELTAKIKQFFAFAAPSVPETPLKPVAAIKPRVPLFAAASAPQLVAIGVSTGGPSALATILPEFPANFPIPILVVQHMPPLFTRLLAERLKSSCLLPVEEARDGELVKPGRILIAPGNFHMKTERAGAGVRILLEQTAPINSCRPAVDALFSSLAENSSGAILAVILTGMGHDGLDGCRLLKARGGYVIAQDESSSAVWGMPGAVVAAGLADAVRPLDRITAAILDRVPHSGYRQSIEAECRL